MVLPLQGKKVLDLSRGVAASFCTQILAEFGAEVIKIESPAGDTMRPNPPLFEGTGATFWALNRNKKSLVMDLREQDQRDRLIELARTADLVFENFRPGVMNKLGVGYEALSEANPAIVLCSVSAFGQEGSWAGRASHELNLLALSGFLSLTASADGAPHPPVPLFSAMVGGSMWSAIGALLALERARLTGKGLHVQVDIFHSMLSIMSPEIVGHVATGQPQTPGNTWNTGPMASYNLYKSSDGHWMALGALEPKYWRNFCLAFDRPDLLDHGFPHKEKPEWTREQVAGIIASRSRDELLAKADESEMMLDPVCSLDDVLGLEPARERGAVFSLKTPEGIGVPQVRLPLTFGMQEGHSAPPKMGEHNGEYLGDEKKRILVVYHSQGGATEALARAAARGVGRAGGVEAVLKRAGNAGAGDLLGCDGLLIVTPEYFGTMAGAVKDFFDRTYEAVGERTFRLPYALLARAGNDGRGAVAAVERIAQGYKWKKVAESQRFTGEPEEVHIEKAEETGHALALGVAEGIF